MKREEENEKTVTHTLPKPCLRPLPPAYAHFAPKDFWNLEKLKN